MTAYDCCNICNYCVGLCWFLHIHTEMCACVCFFLICTLLFRQRSPAKALSVEKVPFKSVPKSTVSPPSATSFKKKNTVIKRACSKLSGASVCHTSYLVQKRSSTCQPDAIHIHRFAIVYICLLSRHGVMMT